MVHTRCMRQVIDRLVYFPDGTHPPPQREEVVSRRSILYEKDVGVVSKSGNPDVPAHVHPSSTCDAGICSHLNRIWLHSCPSCILRWISLRDLYCLCLVDPLGHDGLERLDTVWSIWVPPRAALGDPRRAVLVLCTRVSSSRTELVAHPRHLLHNCISDGLSVGFGKVMVGMLTFNQMYMVQESRDNAEPYGKYSRPDHWIVTL